MGFLRKIGRKIKKKLNKVFGEKLGSIVGFVGLYFAMGAVAKQLSGWMKSTFGAGKGKSTAKAVELTSKVSDSAQAAIDAKTSADATATIASAADKTISGTVASTGARVDTLIANSTTKSEMFNNWVGGHESLFNSGQITPTVSNSLTDTVTSSISNADIYKQTTGEVFENLAQPKIDFNEISKQVVDLKDQAAFEKDVFSKDLFSGSKLTPIDGSTTVAQAAANPARYATLPSDATFGQKVGRFVGDPVGMSKEFVRSKASDVGSYITGDFVPDMAQGALTGYVNNTLNPPLEPEFQSAGVAGPIGMEQAQAAHMAEMGPMLAASNLSNVRTFTDLANQTLYGTGTPSYMQGIYQPLPIPNLS